MAIVITAFGELLKSAIRYQGISEMSCVVVEHPIAGHNQKGVYKLAEGAFPQILKAATKWQLTGK
jgi:hypothetical protein